MLSILEKVQYVFSGLVVAAVIAAYAVWGSAGTPTQFQDPIKQIRPAPKVSIRPATPGAPTAPPPAAPAMQAEDRAILDRLAKEQKVAVGGRELTRQDYQVPQERIEYLKREPNYLAELDKAGHEKLPGADGKMTRLRLKNVDNDSLIKQFGIENNDVIEMIDGERIDFQGESLLNQKDRFNRLIEKIEKGGKISLTVTRGGQPMQIGFQR